MGEEFSVASLVKKVAFADSIGSASAVRNCPKEEDALVGSIGSTLDVGADWIREQVSAQRKSNRVWWLNPEP